MGQKSIPFGHLSPEIPASNLPSVSLTSVNQQMLATNRLDDPSCFKLSLLTARVSISVLTTYSSVLLVSHGSSKQMFRRGGCRLDHAGASKLNPCDIIRHATMSKRKNNREEFHKGKMEIPETRVGEEGTAKRNIMRKHDHEPHRKDKKQGGTCANHSKIVFSRDVSCMPNELVLVVYCYALPTRCCIGHLVNVS